jgi:acyl-CoA synthetase (AMP-forming)/AMP-acid ligase II
MERLIGGVVEAAAAADPAKPAATLGDAVITFGALDAAADRLAAALRGRAVGVGDLVGWWSGPSLDTLVVMTACARAGAIFAPLSPQLGDGEARDILDYVEPALLICRPELVDRADGVELEALVAGAAAPAPVRNPELRDSDPHILYLTSGSTGRPKGALVSHRASWLRSRKGHGSLGEDVAGVVCAFPLFHYAGWQFVLEAWLAGTTAHLVPRASGAELVATIERHGAEAIYCIPAVWERILAEPGDLSSIRWADTGTSALSEDLLGRIAERLPGARTGIFYGASEAGRISALWHEEIPGRSDSVGRVLEPGRLAIDADGEILFGGPTLMDGYLRMRAETEAALADGWYRTGDLGSLDDEGFLRITGRKREVIRSGGETISPAEVEAEIGPLAGVAELAVVGLPDQTWGEVVCAVVVLEADGAPPSVESLRARLDGLAPHKHPRVVATVGSIPRTAATGQVQRARLRQAVLDLSSLNH